MKIYFAGDLAIAEKIQSFFSEPLKILLSYHYVKNKSLKDYVKENKIFLDSGAFSAMTLGAEIDIKKYIKYIKENEKNIEYYANLDVIKDPKKTLENQRIMEEEGLNPIPVFHLNSDFEKYLVPLLNKYDHIALGEIFNKRGNYLDYVFLKYLTKERKIKVHGFGVTGILSITRYPWYSVDSTSAIKFAAYGVTLIPRKNGNYVFNNLSWKFHYCEEKKLSEKRKKYLFDYLDEKGIKFGRSVIKEVPFDYVLQEGEKWIHGKRKESKKKIEIIKEPGIVNDFSLRAFLNIHYFLQLEKEINENFEDFNFSFLKKNFILIFS